MGHDRHNGECRVRTFLADDHIGLELFDQSLSCLCRRQWTARRIFILNFELVSVHAGLIELIDCELGALLILHTEIGPWARNRKQTADLNDFFGGDH